eukprot:5876712-Pleurochrysis_carterae.AAC.1
MARLEVPKCAASAAYGGSAAGVVVVGREQRVCVRAQAAALRARLGRRVTQRRLHRAQRGGRARQARRRQIHGALTCDARA